MQRLLTTVAAVFPGTDASVLNGETPLRALNGWDSMNSVNLALELEQAFGVQLFSRDIVLTGDMTLAQVLAIVDPKGAVS